MSAILTSLNRTLLAGAVLLVLLALLLAYLGDIGGESREYINFLFRWLHVVSGIMWIGLLWYFNFVQIPSMPKIPDEQKPAVAKVIAPTALFWFRWAALATLATGIILASLNGYLVEALFHFGATTYVGHTAIGIGMWLGVIMAFNVWFIIWPCQKVALGIVPAKSSNFKACCARRAMLFSRINTLLSIPMLYAMVSAQTLYSIS